MRIKNIKKKIKMEINKGKMIENHQRKINKIINQNFKKKTQSTLYSRQRINKKLIISRKEFKY